MSNKKLSDENNLTTPSISSDGSKEIFDISQKVGIAWYSFKLTLANLLAWLKSKLRPYDAYKGLLTVTVVQQTSGLLVIGRRYFIRLRGSPGNDTFLSAGSFICGADPNLQGQGTLFEATSITPSVWTDGTVLEYLAPSFVSLDPYNIPVTYLMDSDTASATAMKYWVDLKSAGLFTANKTYMHPLVISYNPTTTEPFKMVPIDINTITLKRHADARLSSLAAFGTPAQLPIDIKVYS